jgi:Tfp pilus assembly protein PilF
VESVALAHRADLQEKNGEAAAAAQSYQHGLALDAKAGDAHGAALDWFNYGQFLRQQNAPGEMVLACFLRAENLLGDTSSAEYATVQTAERQVESKMGSEATGAARKSLPALQERAANFAPESMK